jgi:hypothetical protein
MLSVWLAALALGGCAGSGPETADTGAAPLRGFGVHVDEAIAPRVPMIHVRTCGSWGCHEQDVPVHISGPVSAMPCPTAAAPDTACGAVQRPGPGPGFGYAPVPGLTLDQVTVTVTTPDGAPLRIDAEVVVRPVPVCPGGAGRTTCPGAVPQAQLRVAADRTVTQSR